MVQRKELSPIEQRILVVLLENGELTMSDLIERSKTSPNAVLKAVQSLKERGLVIERRENVFPKRKFLSLTEKGTKVAVIFRDLLKQLRELRERTSK